MTAISVPSKARQGTIHAGAESIDKQAAQGMDHRHLQLFKHPKKPFAVTPKFDVPQENDC